MKMLTKIPIRLRLTILSVLLLTGCCVGLTAVLNFSANNMVTQIEAILITTPAQTIPAESVPQTDLMPAVPAQTAQAKDTFQQKSILVMVLFVALGGVLTYFVAGRALLPLQKLSAEMKNRTVDTLSQRLPVPQSGDEIADLTGSFNSMSEKLEEAFAMQKRFSQSAAHELRTPLTVLKTKVEVFRKKSEHTQEEYDKLLGTVTGQTDRLASLVKELLELTNMDALDCGEAVALKATLAEVCEELSGLAQERGVSFSLTGAERTICGNRNLLHRAFYNLVENAVKYNTQGGSVTLCVREKNGRSLVTVTDTGIGIPTDAQPLVFEPFYRVDKSRSRQMGGAGLGLATVKAVVEKHQGEVTVQSRPEGGTVFEIALS